VPEAALGDLVEQPARRNAPIDPETVGSPEDILASALLEGLCLVYQLPFAIVDHGVHEVVGCGHRDIEVGQLSLPVLDMNEALDVGMIHPQHPHLGTAACTGGFQGLARAIEQAHVGDGTAGPGPGAPHERAARTDGGEIVADSASFPQSLRRLLQSRVDPRTPADRRADGPRTAAGSRFLGAWVSK
jgi:hypothetical protein